MLLDKISLTAIARGLQISELWLQQGVNHKSKNVLREVKVRPNPKRRLRVHSRSVVVQVSLTESPPDGKLARRL